MNIDWRQVGFCAIVAFIAILTSKFVSEIICGLLTRLFGQPAKSSSRTAGRLAVLALATRGVVLLIFCFALPFAIRSSRVELLTVAFAIALLLQNSFARWLNGQLV